MPFYRLISKKELEYLVAKKCIEPSSESWFPYKAGEVICIFESNSPSEIFNKYCRAIGSHRQLKIDDTILVLELSNISKFEFDKSQAGWPESRVHLGPIPIEKVSVIAEATVSDNKHGRIEFSNLKIYQKPKLWRAEKNDFLQNNLVNDSESIENN